MERRASGAWRQPRRYVLPDGRDRFRNALAEDPTGYRGRDFEEQGSCATLGRALVEFRTIRPMEGGTGSVLAVEPPADVLRDNPACGVLRMSLANAIGLAQESLANVAQSRKAH